MILVTGGTGNVGREVVRQLHAGGHPVRVLSRNPARVSFPAGVDVAAGDLTVPETWPAALDRVGAIFFVRVPGSESFLQTARNLGTKRVVFLSSGAIDASVENVIGRVHLEAEEFIRRLGVQWTFLRPGAFMSNALQWAASVRAEGVVRAPFGEVETAPIDARDIASVAAAALVSAEHQGRTYGLTGPEALTPVEQVRILGQVLGRDLRFEPVPDAVAAEAMRRFAPPQIVEALCAMLRDQAKHPAVVLETVREVTGQAPHTFRQWAADHADRFA